MNGPPDTLFQILPLLFLGFGLLSIVLVIWALVDCVTNEPSEGNDKLIWVLIIVLTGFIGAILYFIVRRPKRIAEQNHNVR